MCRDFFCLSLEQLQKLTSHQSFYKHNHQRIFKGMSSENEYDRK